jgi:hypothetical protein
VPPPPQHILCFFHSYFLCIYSWRYPYCMYKVKYLQLVNLHISAAYLLLVFLLNNYFDFRFFVWRNLHPHLHIYCYRWGKQARC